MDPTEWNGRMLSKELTGSRNRNVSRTIGFKQKLEHALVYFAKYPAVLLGVNSVTVAGNFTQIHGISVL
jgi:hypothetical protein